MGVDNEAPRCDTCGQSTSQSTDNVHDCISVLKESTARQEAQIAELERRLRLANAKVLKQEHNLRLQLDASKAQVYRQTDRFNRTINDIKNRLQANNEVSIQTKLYM